MNSGKKEYVLDLIKKSISMGISDSDIIDTLREANLSEADAKQLIAEARNESVEKVVVEEKKVSVDSARDLSISDQISMQLGLEVKEKKVSQDVEKNSVKQKEKSVVNQSQPVSQKKGLFSGFLKKKEKVDQSGLVVKETNSESSVNTTKTMPLPVRASIDNNGLKVVESDNISSDNIDSDVVDSDNIDSDVVDFDNIESGVVGSDNIELGSIESNLVDENIGSLKASPKDSLFNKTKMIKSKDSTDSLKAVLYGESKSNIVKNDLLSSNSKDDLWNKGIIVAVNSRLNEMKKIRDDIDTVVGVKVDFAVKKETNKFKVLLESQKDLIISSNKLALEQKQKEISFIIDSKLAEIKKESKQLSEVISQIHVSKVQQEELLIQINSVLVDAKKTKSQLLIEMNSELIKSKSQAQEFVDNAKLQMEELDSRINKTLEFEKNVAEGLIQEAEQKIENLTIQKADDLLSELELKLINLKSVEKNLDLDSIEQKIRVLDQFKKEFLNNMEENIEKINLAISALNQRNEIISNEISEKVLVIDAKLEELNRFEKDFADHMEKMIKQDFDSDKSSVKNVKQKTSEKKEN